VRLFLIVAASIALKVLVLSVLVSRPDFAWVDPDGYLRQAAVLTRSGAWAWTIDAIGYTWNQTLWTLPPGYPVFLSLWYRHPDFDPMAAALAQIAMSGVGVVALYWLVAALHTPRAALAAAALSAFWFPGIVAPHVFTQEAVFIPLLVAAIAALAVCTTGAARPWGFAVAGVLMAAAALTRAMPLYFLPMVAVLFALGPRAGRVSWSRQAAYFGAAALLIAPYVVWLSVERGRVVLIDDHAAIIQLRDEPVVPPTLTGSARALARNAWEQAPARVDMARGMLQVYGRSWLYHIAPREDARAARRLEWTVRLWLDLLFVLAAVAAPWGLALARQRRLALLLAAWAAFTVAISVAAGFSGARYRAPLEFVLIAGAAIAVTGGRRRPTSARTGAAAAAACGVIVVLTVPQLRTSWNARAAYGYTPEPLQSGEMLSARARGPSGFYITARDRTVAIMIETLEDEPFMEFVVAVSGRQARRVAAAADRPASVRFRVPVDGVHFVEVHPVSPLGLATAYRVSSR
jgi:4-amino-4-deoxy-L-arabinose transferase-like glycosyltransferase